MKSKYYAEDKCRKTKWQERIRLELRRIAKLRRKNNDHGLFWAEQALGWAMQGNYAPPSWAFITTAPAKKEKGIFKQDLATALADFQRVDAELAHVKGDLFRAREEVGRLNNIITGIFPETAALHEILRRAGCVSVTQGDYDELQSLRARLTAAEQDAERLAGALNVAQDALIDAERLLLDVVAEAKDGASKSPAGFWLDGAKIMERAQSVIAAAHAAWRAAKERGT